MDGIIPTLILMILLALAVSVISTLYIGAMVLFSPTKLGSKSKSMAIFNVCAMSIGTVITFNGSRSIIGQSPLIYMVPLMLVVSILLLLKCVSTVEHNQRQKKDANNESGAS